MSYKKMLLALLMLSYSFVLNAQEIREFYNGARAMAMGGVYVTTTNDETALIVQPAGLGRVRDSYITVIDPEVSIGENSQKIVGLEVMSFLDPNLTLDLVKAAEPGDRLHQSLKLFPSMVFTNFGIGLLANYTTDASLSEDATEYRLFMRQDVGLIAGLNLRLFDGRIKIGVNARGVNRTEISRTDLDPNAIHSISSLGTEGFGIGIDAGILFQMPWDWIPTLGAVFHDVGATKYDLLDGIMNGLEDKPETTPARLDVGIGIHPILGKNRRLILSIEGRDVLNYAAMEDVAEYLHAGVEINFSDTFFLRFGANQSYLTYGFEFAILNYQFQLTSYGEEVGAGAVKEENRRYMGKFVFRF